MSKLIRGISVVVPGPCLAWVADWLRIFDRTFIVRPHSPELLMPTAIAIGAVLTVILAAILFNSPAPTLKRNSIFVGLVACLALFGIFGVRTVLSGSVPRGTAQTLYLVYDALSFVFLVLVIVTILLAIMYALNSSSGSGPND